MLKLYVRMGCPFCSRVLNFMNEAGIDFEKKDIDDEANYEGLMELGNKSQVPFLVDEDKKLKLYESDAIIDYIQQEYMRE